MTILPSALLVNDIYVLPLCRYLFGKNGEGAEFEIRSLESQQTESKSTNEETLPILPQNGKELYHECTNIQVPPGVDQDEVQTVVRMNRIDRWFYTSFGEFIYKNRKVLIIFSTLMVVILGTYLFAYRFRNTYNSSSSLDI